MKIFLSSPTRLCPTGHKEAQVENDVLCSVGHKEAPVVKYAVHRWLASDLLGKYGPV